MIITPLGFFQVQMERVFWQSFELRQPHFCQSPETFYAIDMDLPARKFVA